MTDLESFPTSIVTKSTGVADGGDSVSTMLNDAVTEDKNRRLLMNKFLEEQAALGNLEAKANIGKKVADFTRTDVFGKLKFVAKKVQLESTGNLAKYVTQEFVEKRNADSAEETVRQRVMWWGQYRSVVYEALTRRWAEAMSTLKRGLVGT